MAFLKKRKQPPDTQTLHDADLDAEIDPEAMIDTSDAEPERKRNRRVMLPILSLLILGALGAALYFDIFGINTRYVAPVIQKTPFVGKFVSSTTGGALSGASKKDKSASAELLAEKDAEIERLTQENAQLAAQNALNTDDLARLQTFADQQVQFKADKAAFDAMIAAGDPAAYSTFYESINPDDAENLYQAAQAAVQHDKDYKKYLGTIGQMDEAQAALVMERLSKTNMPLVVELLNGLSSDIASTILSSMDAAAAANVVKQMQPK
jgi:flagellar motility protein MotE (MotC chaperone)